MKMQLYIDSLPNFDVQFVRRGRVEKMNKKKIMKAHSTAQYFSIMPVNRVCILLLFGTCRYDMIVSDLPNGMTTKKKRIWRFRLSPRYACICVFVFYYFIINIYVYLCVVMPNQFGWLFADSNGIITNNSCFQFIAHEQLIEYTVYVC